MPRDSATVVDRGAGCLLGGALGDALGAPVQFLSSSDIQRQHGPAGVIAPPRPALITDDTQLTLFTADGYLRAFVRGRDIGSWEPAETVWRSYRQWLTTQQQERPAVDADGLLRHDELYASRSPGLTCLRALASNGPRHHDDPQNDASGCGGVMRTAPAGFAPSPRIAYDLGSRFAALTHGSPSGWAPAGALALLVHLLAIRGRPLRDAVDQAIGRVLRDDPETARLLTTAVLLAEAHRGTTTTAVGADRLGGGWTGPEALAIAVYAVLLFPRAGDFTDAVRVAANHSGGSDSTASIAGSIHGALHGTASLPSDWLARLELADVIRDLGHDLGRSAAGLDFDEERYR
ncbi:ADP-ribosylglycohydrolase family protein [Solihabitans fulvus]|uniref:ADP-ribosylglycohydrolase family protein n=1 Tax=Solihabitans fulvus TaxID=1892852 RepID=A0A5B2XGK1_9PSEU|nr:ADP-ribosylglycohydrolase family protein [Solihabitans fulvus]KAA2262376.1 ADP-ribosylglycohydrolase family protein [Solihabitans fulvus]